MSIKATQWAYTHALKPGAFVALLTIADEADSDGYCYMGKAKLAWKANMGERTLRRHLAELRKMDLLHSEMRMPDWGKGRQVDAIVLHLDLTGTKGAFPGQAALDRQKREDRKQFEVEMEDPDGDDNPVDNSETDHLANMAEWSVVPSQPEAANLAGWSTTRPNLVDHPAKSGHKASCALKGTRARLTRQSVPSVPDELSTEDDGLTEDHSSSDRPAVVEGVALGQLRERVGADLNETSDEVVGRIVSIVLRRAKGQVKYRLPFVAQCVKAEPWVLISEAAAELETERRLAAPEKQSPLMSARASRPTQTCRIHDVDYMTQCPCCRADALVTPTGDDGDKGAPWDRPGSADAWTVYRGPDRKC